MGLVKILSQELISFSLWFTDREVGVGVGLLVPERAWSICLLSIKSSQSIPETLRLAQRTEPLFSVTLTLVKVQLLLIVSRDALLFEV